MSAVSFQTKKESNEMKEEQFMKLSPSERFIHFLKLCEALAPFSKPKTDFGTNLVLERKAAK